MMSWLDRSLTDGVIRLSAPHMVGGDRRLGIVQDFEFDIYPVGLFRRSVGYVSVRLGESPMLYYLGHIGYRVDEAWRGQGFAARALCLLKPFLQQVYGRTLVITTNEDNIPSRLTCLKVGCELESIVPVPVDWQTEFGTRTKCRYVLDIARMGLREL